MSTSQCYVGTVNSLCPHIISTYHLVDIMICRHISWNNAIMLIPWRCVFSKVFFLRMIDFHMVTRHHLNGSLWKFTFVFVFNEYMIIFLIHHKSIHNKSCHNHTHNSYTIILIKKVFVNITFSEQLLRLDLLWFYYIWYAFMWLWEQQNQL